MQVWGGKSVVNGQQQVVFIGYGRNRLDINNVHHGVRGSLYPDELCVLIDVCLDVCSFLHAHKVKLKSKILKNLGEQTVGTSIKVIGGDDFKSGKTTLPVILAWEKSDKKEKDFWLRTMKMLDQKESDLQLAKEIIKKYGIINKCREIASNSINISLDALKTFPDNKYKRSLEKFAKDSLLRNN